MLRRAVKLGSAKSLVQRQHSTLSSSDQKLVTLLQSCKQSSEISQIHGFMVKNGLDVVPFTLSKLLAYSAADISYAASIFKHIRNPNLYMFNTMLRAYSISDDPKKALDIFNYMRTSSVVFDEFTFVSVLKSSAELMSTWTGIGIHSIVLRCGIVFFLNVKNTLLQFYSVCGRIKEAHQLFDEFSGERDLVSWNTMMGGYLRVAQYSEVVDLFRQLLNPGNLRAGKTTMFTVLSAMGELVYVSGGKSLHGFCFKVGFCSDLKVASVLISMYGNVGSVDSGRKVFDEVDKTDVVVWNCLIDGYAKNDMIEVAFSLFPLMKLQGVKPNSSTFAGVLSACAASGSLVLAQRVHDFIEEQQLVLDAVLGTALVNMYVKCGLLYKAIDVFGRIEGKDVMCWTAMIMGCGIHGEARNAISLYHRMEEEGIRPNKVTFLAVLSACSHVGLVSEGMSFFRKMVQHYGLKPDIEHYGCIIDLLGRAGLLEDAHMVTKTLSTEGDATSWRTLLAACRIHGDVELGELVKKELENFYNEHPADALSLASTYAVAGRVPKHVNEVEKNLDSMKDVKCTQVPKKEAGYSSVLLCDKEIDQVKRLEISDLGDIAEHAYAT